MVVRSVWVVGLLAVAGLSLTASVVSGGIAPGPAQTPAQAVDADAQRLEMPAHVPVPVLGSWEAYLQAMSN